MQDAPPHASVSLSSECIRGGLLACPQLLAFCEISSSPSHNVTTLLLFSPLLICPSLRLVGFSQLPCCRSNTFISPEWHDSGSFEMNVLPEGSFAKSVCCVWTNHSLEILFDTWSGRLSLFVVLLPHQNYCRVGIVVFVDVEMLEDLS